MIIYLVEYKPGTLTFDEPQPSHWGVTVVRWDKKDPLPTTAGKKFAVWRWGYSGEIAGEENATLIINPRLAVLGTSNKTLMKEILLKTQEIVTPPVLAEGPVIVKRVFHSGGRGAMIFDKGYYVERFVPVDQEFRVYVFGGRTVLRKKVWVGPYRGTLERGEIRSRSRGWRIRYDPPTTEESSQVRNMAVRAVKALGLHSGAVDVGVKGSEATVFEVNSGPRIEASYISNWYLEKAIDFVESMTGGA
ncbi:MAG: hypothetical protein QW231_06630 [Candidatus Bathyarchaeia archaeon]